MIHRWHTAGLPTPDQLLLGSGQEPSSPLAPTPQHDDATERAPLSAVQQRLWLLGQWERDTTIYNVQAAIALRGALQIERLRQSMLALVERHAALRSHFVVEGGRPWQVLGAAHDLSLAQIELAQIAPDQQATALERASQAEAQRPFDLEQGLLLRATLLRLAVEEHVLLLTVPQIVADAPSLVALLAELAALYRSADQRTPHGPRALRRATTPAETLATQLGYWQRQLGGDLPVLRLPTDRPRQPQQRYTSALHHLTLPPELHLGLRALSQQTDSSLFTVLLAAFTVLLARYADQQDIVVGVPIANRDREADADPVGCYANLLPLRCAAPGELSFRELLARVGATARDAYARRQLPFATLLEQLPLPRDLSYHPVFQALFTFQPLPLPEATTPELTLTPLQLISHPATVDWAFAIGESDAGLELTVDYNAELFDATTIARVGQHFGVLLAAISASPDQRLADLPLLTAAELRGLLTIDRPPLPASAIVCLHQLFEAQAAQRPDAVALSYEGQQLSYGELNRRANQLAHYLIRQGVRPEVPVVVYMDRSFELIVALLATFKAGGVCVYLDPAEPAERLQFMIADAGARALLVQPHLEAQLPPHHARLVSVSAADAFADEPGHNPDQPVDPDNAAYIIFTSGSTGKPKGAVLSHAMATISLLLEQANAPLAASDRHLLKFASSHREIFFPLMTGAQMVIARPGMQQDSAYLVRLIAEQRVTVMSFVPSMLQVLLAQPGLSDCASLRYVATGGEVLPAEVQAALLERLPIELHNNYSLTEAFYAIPWRCLPGGAERLPTTMQVILLDRNGQPVPVGTLGEVHIGGACLARGYLGRPALTAERFIPHPFSDQPGARLYRTGDLARYRSDGSLEFVGRIDHQVKIRGLRVELGEIEAALLQRPDVKAAVVVARDDLGVGGAPSDKRLVAYVVAEEPRTGDLGANQEPRGEEPGSPRSVLGSAQLRSWLSQRLPSYMVPSAFVLLDALPLLPNGKADRLALPAPSNLRPELETAYVAPRSATEQRIAAMWRELLGVEQIGVLDNFYELGGHSLLLIQLHAQLQETFQREIAITDLFTYPTISLLARFIDQAQEQPAAPAADSQRVDRRKANFEQRKQRLGKR